jgi:hypothetical protein
MVVQEKVMLLGKVVVVADTAPLTGATVVQTTGVQLGAAGEKLADAVQVAVAVPTML